MSVKINKPTEKTAKKVTPENTERVVSADELHPLQTLRSEIDALFDSVLSGLPAMRLPRPKFDIEHWREPFRDPLRRFEDTFGTLSKMAPRADIKQTDKAVTVTAELPGVVEGDIEVSVADGLLTISAEKKEETRRDDENVHLAERHYGSITRTFTLPSDADPDKAKASFKDGILTIAVPMKAKPKSAAKKIPIKN